ncbi:unnamed protein product [Merluccius merluccius]
MGATHQLHKKVDTQTCPEQKAVQCLAVQCLAVQPIPMSDHLLETRGHRQGSATDFTTVQRNAPNPLG